MSLIAGLYKAGDTVDEILESYPHLRPSWIHDAIGYYLDHQDDIGREIRESRVECLTEQHDLTVDERGFVRFQDSIRRLQNASERIRGVRRVSMR